MGRLLQLLFQHSREEILTKMSILLLLIALTAGAQGAPGGGHFAYGHQQQHCHTEYNIQIEQSCHDEFDTVVDTTYVEECQDIITQHCHETTQQVHHSSAVVGQDSQVVSQGHRGLSKREANPEPYPVYPVYGHNHHNNLQCFSTPHKQCHQKPVQNQRQECHEEYDVVVDTTYIEECQDIITTHCQQTNQQVHNSYAVVGHDSQVVSQGHGVGKREAQGEYPSEPQCQEQKDRQCHKRPVHNERKVPRKVCKTIVDTTFIEECEETFTTHCHTAHTQVHHTAAVVGQDTHTEHGRRKREAQVSEPEHGYQTGPNCHAKKDRQCHRKPIQNSRQVPLQVCLPVARQVCVPHEIQIPYEVCGHSHVHMEQYPNDLVYVH